MITNEPNMILICISLSKGKAGHFFNEQHLETGYQP